MIGRPFHEVSRDVGLSDVSFAAASSARSVMGRHAHAHRTAAALPARSRGRPASLTRLAADAGYADQAHLARECRRLTGRTPSALLAGGAAAAGERTSGLFKPDLPGRAMLPP